MLSLRMYRAPLDREAVERFPALKDRLRKDLKPVLSPHLARLPAYSLCQHLTFAPPPRSSGRSSGSTLARLRHRMARSSLTAPHLSSLPSTPIAALSRPSAAWRTSKNLRARRRVVLPSRTSARLGTAPLIVKEVMGLTPEPAIYSSQRFDELKAEGRESPTPPSVEEEAAVSLLSDRLLRTLALAIKTSGGLLVRDLPKQLPEARDRAVQIADRLKAGGLVDSEIVIVCGKTQAQVARAPSRDVIADLATRAVKCACGRSLAEERTEEALAITDLGRALLDKARWLTILLVRELERMGVPRHSILVEQTVGGDEIDCLAKSQGI